MTELKIEDIKKVLILGSGTLGLRVGLQAAISGYDVCIYDLTDEILTSTKNHTRKVVEIISEEWNH